MRLQSISRRMLRQFKPQQFFLLISLFLILAGHSGAEPLQPVTQPLQPVKDDFLESEFPARPAPGWVQMIDQGTHDAELTGLFTPDGIKIEIVAREPVVVDPVGMEFTNDGSLFVLEWRKAAEAHHSQYTVTFQDGSQGIVNRMTKPTRDELKAVSDTDGDGLYDQATVIMDDLEIPSMTLHHDGWVYLPSVGHVIRRKQSEPGGPYDMEEEILRGLCGFHHHQVSGVELSDDGWLYVSSGDDDNRGEGSDGSRATVLRTGAVFRCRPDGSQLSEFARGFRNPYRNVVFDSMNNLFHVDNDNEDGSKYQGVRLMHVVEGADYGWRLLPGAVCCRPDKARGAIFGERPGKVPSMLKTGRGSPAGLLIYQGTQFPEFFRGLLIYPDVYRKTVRAYKVERSGSTFRVVEQFTLMTSEDDEFRPCQAVAGPDGAIYILDWRTNSGGAGKLWGDGEHGRIYRLRWAGNSDHPAIPLAPMNSWANVQKASEQNQWELLDSRDGALRKRALESLAAKGPRMCEKFVRFALDESNSLPGRAAAIGGASRFFNKIVLEAMDELLDDRSDEIRRLAAEAIGRNSSTASPPSSNQVEKWLTHLNDPHPAVLRSIAMMLGKIASACDDVFLQNNVASRLLETLANANSQDPYLRDGLIRSIERIGPVGVHLPVKMLQSDDRIGSLSLEESHELCLWVIESFRTREAALALDELLNTGETEQLRDGQLARIFATYRHILVEPAISTDAMTAWLARHPDAGIHTQVAALETMGLMGGDDSQVLVDLASRLLQHESDEARLQAIRAIGGSQLNTLAGELADALRDNSRGMDERREILAALRQLRSRRLPFNNEQTPAGVEGVTEQLAEIADDFQQTDIQAEALLLLSQVDFQKAEPIALRMLDSNDSNVVAAAINTLGAKPTHAKTIAERFLNGTIPKPLLPRVAEVLQRHTLKDKEGIFAKLLTDVFKGGLVVSLDPAEVQRVTNLVAEMGSPQRGREIFLDRKRTQCANCHKLEGFGGSVGPDLSKVWQTHTVGKLMESLLEPSKEIKEGFATWTVLTLDGKVFNGLKITDTRRETLLRDATGKDIRLLAEEIDEKLESKKSLMPEGLAVQLNYQELIDLIAFLKDRDAQLDLRNVERK